ncbi:MAG: calcium-binding protein [Rhizobiales bacterium]|nr:calcium-binding protein [Hyphomicrobiales bacterium]
MATFYANVPVDMTGKSATGEVGYVTQATGNLIQIQYSASFENIGGSFGYNSNSVPYGYVYSDVAYDYYGNVLFQWTADSGVYDATDLYSLARYGTAKQLLSYMFYLDDEIYGSQYKDKLVGYNGHDYIDGWTGNDQLWGGKGYDTFFFARHDGKDTIRDFSRKQDTIMLDSSLASGMRDVRQAAEKYKKGVVLDFGSDEVRIEGLKMKQLNKVDFDFV